MAPSKQKPVSAGDVIGGKYRVERELGEGGVGFVVQARHIELGQLVAIKILVLRDDKEQVARFTQEARASVRLRGEHVAKVTDVGRLDDGTPYMVMEFLEGENLSTLTDRGALPLEDAATFLLQACEGIAEAHSLGIVHRDIKPANLFLTRGPTGRPLVKVLDFGIAKRSDNAVGDTRLTGALAVIGSPPYMSPEQVRASRDVDVRSDVWSLGATLYELLTARVPFDGATVQDVCARILTEQPPPLVHWRPGLPEGMQTVVDSCLAKDPARRFPSVWELAAGLEPFAPPSARNAERVREILFTAPPSGWRSAPPVLAPPRTADATETRSAFGGGASPTGKRTRVAIAAGVAIAVALGSFAAVSRFRAPASEPLGPVPPVGPAAALDGAPRAAAVDAPPPGPVTSVNLAPEKPAPAPMPTVSTGPRPAPQATHRAPKVPSPPVHPESTKM
ncbi:MAG TPA: protein kinase [Polyangiaceae bacterium]|jgi:serine/threonine-protein kinase|nr:protein kinase [Polyangiaceae bacterium]